jgi:hypothetical protein
VDERPNGYVALTSQARRCEAMPILGPKRVAIVKHDGAGVCLHLARELLRLALERADKAGTWVAVERAAFRRYDRGTTQGSARWTAPASCACSNRRTD